MEVNARRRARVDRALQTRPFYLPLQFVLPAAGQISPVSVRTPFLSYDVNIVGAIADSPTREINFKRTENEIPLVYTGDELNLHMTLDEIAGQTLQPGGGKVGAWHFPNPFTLQANRRLTVEMFKTDTTATAQIVNLVLVCVRTFRSGQAEGILTEEQNKLVNFFINARPVPEMRLLKQQIKFDPQGRARNIVSPSVSEPLLIRGCRTTLDFSTIEIKVEGEVDWQERPMPIWAVAAQDSLGHSNYCWLARPVFLPAKALLEMSLTNTLNGVLSDTDGTITWYAETM